MILSIKFSLFLTLERQFKQVLCHLDGDILGLHCVVSICHQTEFPLSLFCPQSLKHLALYGWIRDYVNVTPPTWELQALTTLNLHRVTLNDDSTDKCVGFFSNFTNLKNLTLRDCRLVGVNSFNICHPGLSSLTLEDLWNGVNADTPQLKNLAVKYCSGIRLISAPKLSSLKYKDSHPLDLPADLLLEKVDICISCGSSEGEATARKIVCMLQQLRSVQFLTLNSELIKLLSSSIEIIAHQPSPFANLKSLKIYPAYTPDEFMQPRLSKKKLMQSKVTMSTEVRNYLLNSSPGATFTMVSHEEIRAVKNVTSARNLMTELQDKLKKFTETNMTNIEQDKAPMATVHQQIEDLKGIVSMLTSITTLLEKVPASHQQYKLLAALSGALAEVKTILKKYEGLDLDQCDKKVHEPATSLQPSS
ncbi:hypothetical protein M8C21_008730 [Ambrosia artemisiifolia]|uniref:Uncharacterized protein n=1 Tax=Ambrosia artemisiifolia TaxID=4212 RepID=A0AAD5CL94_AMBAR|nr:hypothetical protein M8C21_008730 [Ambrosia artemisiifolia]